MLKVNIPEQELFDERKGKFKTLKACTLSLEHSLLSISKWEAKFCKPFISKEDKTVAETIEYIRCMSLDSKVDPEVFNYIPKRQLQEIMDYITAPMTATTFSEIHNTRKNHEILTSEVIYYLMVAYQIPFECEKWHLNRLLTLIKICEIKNQPPKKMSKSEIMAQNTRLNAERRKALNR